jgi:hypothetical protein
VGARGEGEAHFSPEGFTVVERDERFGDRDLPNFMKIRTIKSETRHKRNGTDPPDLLYAYA